MNLLKNNFLRRYFFKYFTYGNWGFPCWSGGEWVDDPKLTNWDIKPADDMDKLFKQHDYCYQHCVNFTNFADINLIVGLENLKISGIYKNIYRISAIIVFLIKLIAMSVFQKK